MKRVITLLSIMLILIITVTSCENSENEDIDEFPASDFEYGENEDIEESPAGDFEYIISIDGVTITKYIGESTKVRIPERIEGELVYNIGSRSSESVVLGIIHSGAFQGSKISHVVIPDSVTIIGSLAFQSCDDLQSITIPDSVTFVDRLAFNNCENLRSAVYKGNTYRYNKNTGQFPQEFYDDISG